MLRHRLRHRGRCDRPATCNMPRTCAATRSVIMEMEQRRLNPELFQWLDERQSQLKVVKTTTTPHGQVLDWISIESQHPEGKVPSPPPSEPMPAHAHAHDAKRPVASISFELDDPAVERGPEGT